MIELSAIITKKLYIISINRHKNNNELCLKNNDMLLYYN